MSPGPRVLVSGQRARDAEVSSPLVTLGLEEAWIAASSALVGVVIGAAGALLGNLMSRKTANATIAANSVDIKAQIDGASADVRAQIEAAATTIAAQIEADRRNRIWERQAAAYVDGIKGIRHQQKIRSSQVLNIITGSDPLETPAPVDWSDVEARLLTYSSPAIINRLTAASDAGIKFVTTWRHLDQMPPGTERLKMVDQARQEARDADGLDDELMDTIRAELHAGTGRAPDPPVPLAASAQAPAPLPSP
jgi:hypothetical protein